MTYPLTPETKALLQRLVQERQAAQERLDVAVIATKAALAVPDNYELRDLDVGFEEVANGSNN